MTDALGAVDADFGVVVFTPPSMLALARATCASVRYFMGDTPICLYVDGRASARNFERLGVRVVHTPDVPDRRMQELFFRSLRAKIAALWLAPFERFLYLDADTVVWGDMRVYLEELAALDFLIDQPHPAGDPLDHARRYILDPDLAARRRPGFDAHAHAADFANMGVFFARRGALDLDEAIAVTRLSIAEPELLFWDQGILNLLLFEGADRGTLRVGQRRLQTLAALETPERLARDFPLVDGRPVVVGEPRALHWAAQRKPRLRPAPLDYFQPAAFFRQEFRRQVRGGTLRPTDRLRLRAEDVPPRLAFRTTLARDRFLQARRRLRLALELRARAALGRGGLSS
jgi:hypothetical protein